MRKDLTFPFKFENTQLLHHPLFMLLAYGKQNFVWNKEIKCKLKRRILKNVCQLTWSSVHRIMFSYQSLNTYVFFFMQIENI